MDSKRIFSSCGLLSIIIITMWTHNDEYNLTLEQAKAQQAEFREHLANLQ